jgi:hypothetical protein
MSEYNGEIWAEFAAMRRELKALKATVARLEAADLVAYLFRQYLHDVTRCADCGEMHECAVVPAGPVSVAHDGLKAICQSCFIRGHERSQAAA